MRIGWIVANTNSSIASTRYRCYYPAMALAEHSVESTIFSASRCARVHLNKLDVVVFVKRLDADSVRLATEARALGKRIYLDLCDNVVIPNYEADSASQQVPWLVAISAIADAVITTNGALTESLKSVLSARARFCEIPDQIETLSTVQKANSFGECPGTGIRSGRQRWITWPTLRLYIFARRLNSLLKTARRNPSHGARVLRRKLAATLRRDDAAYGPIQFDRKVEPGKAAEKTVLWFGNFGSPYSDFGMLALLRAAPSLEKVARDIEFELLVVSNNRTMFENCIAPLPLRTRYEEWTSDAVFRALQTATVCLLPSGRDAFSLTKSANRAVLALYHGVPVISSKMRALEPLASSIVFDEWETGLRRFLNSECERRKAVAAAHPVIDALFAPKAIARAWLKLLGDAPPHRVIRSAKDASKPNVGIVIDLIQDVDVLLPLIDEVRCRKAVNLRVWLTDFVTKQSPRAIRALMERDIVPYYLERRSAIAGDSLRLNGLDCLVTASESTLPVHQTCHELVLQARRLGIRTYTLQHGLENVGLTYFDKTYGRDVAFASDYVLTWADRHRLPADLGAETLRKCIPVGRARRNHPTLPRPEEWGRMKAIGIFENLHWDRYSSSYREAFVRDLVSLATSRDDIVLIIKPHHAGRFLAQDSSLLRDAPTSIVVLDPRNPIWEPFTAGALLPHCAAVITTPSTVALDAAELDIPVAVAGYDLNVTAYAPLPILHNAMEWQGFIGATQSREKELRQTLTEFRDRTCITGDAAKRTVDLMLAHCSSTVEKYELRANNFRLP